MKKILILYLVCLSTFAAGAADTGKLFILGGELSNSAATCTADIDEVMPRMKQLGLNTVLVPAYWELLEPEEGRFDFTLTDRTIAKARENQLKIVLLWFGAWKNSMSCYTPVWFKKDTRKYPRARTRSGKPLEIASAFSRNVLEADNRAFAALMERIKATDADGTVVMVQIENEIGMLEDARDHSPLADEAYNRGVPQVLADYLKKNKLHPWLQARFTGKGKAWAEVFGNDLHTDEIFMAYHYACYVERLAQTARSILPGMPLFVNAAMNSRGRRPGEYPSAGPLAHLIDLWHCGAPSIDLLAPDIYDTGFKGWAAQYDLWNNRLFIPEIRCNADCGARAMYVFGEHRALGFSPFAIDQAPAADTAPIVKSYALLNQLRPYLQPPGKGAEHPQSWGLLFDQDDKERIITDGSLSMTCRHYYTLPWDPRATDGTVWPEGGAAIIKLAHGEYLLAGTGVVVTFATDTERRHEEKKTLGEDGFAEAANTTGGPAPQGKPFTGKRIGIGSVDEVSIGADGAIRCLRRLNGDQTHQGRHVRIAAGDWKILHVRLYEYQ